MRIFERSVRTVTIAYNHRWRAIVEKVKLRLIRVGFHNSQELEQLKCNIVYFQDQLWNYLDREFATYFHLYMSYSPGVNGFIAEGSKLYAVKDYDQAATKYADACGAFNEENGQDDADLLLLYGKALFQAGVAKSGVLGGVSNVEKKEVKEEQEDDEKFQFEEGIAQEDEDEDGNEEEGEEEGEEDGGEEEGDDEDGPEQSDFEAAWEILDLARSLFSKRLDELSTDAEGPFLKTDDEEPTSDYVTTLRNLSEAYDLLGEVSLESENFPQAASDLERCLELRQKLYNLRLSALISESHYKLSLALEFCVEDSELRKKAAEQMRLAISCVRLRNSNETDAAKKADTAELLKDLEERHNELKKDPEQELQMEQMDIIKGILGEATSGANPAVNNLTAMVKKKPVNDLSSMVKKRTATGEQAQAKRPKKD